MRDYLVHLRPKGFVPASILVLTGFVVSPARGRGADLFLDLALLFVGYVVLLSGGTLMLNSAIDRDDGPVTFLERPPPPPRRLGAAGLVLMAGSVALFSTRGPWPGGLAAACVILSIGYSHGFGGRRWKEIPLIDSILNGVGYGALSPALGYSITGAAPTPTLVFACIAFTLSLTATTPAAQIYQLPPSYRPELERNTASVLGGRGTLTWTATLLAIAIVPIVLGYVQGETRSLRATLGTAAFVVFFVYAIAKTISWRRAPFSTPYAQLKRVLEAALAARIAWMIASAP